jgi:methyl-accepting chemotaxis protein
MATRTYRRTQYFVKPDLQTKYAFMFVLAIGVGLNLGVILALLAPMLKNDSPIFPTLYILLALSFVVLVAGISILFTHKIAGPIFKIEKSFRQIIDEKDLSLRVFLRTDDELQELAEEINRLLEHFRNSLLLENQKSEAILAKLDYVIDQLEGESALPITEVHERLADLRQKIEDTGLKYKLK